jgi:NAD(P)-dependent dehydrogenase (short-subunit alcohol dehydrogenase family)
MALSHVVGIVTGGASGLGAATAACLVRRGARVVVADLDHQRDAFARLAATACADATRTRAVTDNAPVLAFAETDVTNEDQVKGALDMAEAIFGEPGALILLSVDLNHGATSDFKADALSYSECGCQLCWNSSSQKDTFQEERVIRAPFSSSG